MTNFFENSVTTKATKAAILNVLLSPKVIKQWDLEIESVTEVDGGDSFTVRRRHEAINQLEMLTVENNDGTVVYRVSGDRVSYDVSFILMSVDELTIIKERVSIDTDKIHGIPVKLLQPIAKRGFKQTLESLVKFAENTDILKARE